MKTNGDVSLFGAFPSDSFLRFMLRLRTEHLPLDVAATVSLVLHADEWNRSYNKSVTVSFAEAKPDEDGVRVFTADVRMADFLAEYDLGEDGLFYYYYSVKTGEDELCLGGERPTALEKIENHIGERQLLLYAPEYHTSEAFRHGVVYHIFVDRFAKSEKHPCPVKEGAVLDPDWESGIPQYGAYPGAEVANNVFFGGSLYGIAEKMDYIASLGVTTIYLSPVFDADSNHKYDTGDYLTVDAMFGGDDALRELCRAAEERGIRILLDGVFNHTGDDSIYFNRRNRYDSVGAYQSKESPYADWYHFRSFPDEYECWWGVKIMPRVDSENASYRDFINRQVVPKWMDAGVFGWRLDVADELSDAFLEDFRKAVREQNPDGVILGEVWEDASDKVSYGRRRSYLRGRQLDAVMNYPLRDAVISYVKDGEVGKLRRFTEGTYRRYPKGSSDTLLNFLGTHDTERILTVFGGESGEGKSNEELSVLRMTPEQREAAAARLMFAYALLAGLPGVPCVFYGDEAGLEGYRDPFCRRPFPWHAMDERILAHYRRIGAIRKNHAVFRDGLFRIHTLTPDVFAYVREPLNKNGETMLVLANRSEKREFLLPDGAKSVETGQSCAGPCVLDAWTVGYFVLE
ncbi:MAG: glycoside hydrolase family 13 protein [Eubacteriales bacterium]